MSRRNARADMCLHVTIGAAKVTPAQRSAAPAIFRPMRGVITRWITGRLVYGTASGTGGGSTIAFDRASVPGIDRPGVRAANREMQPQVGRHIERVRKRACAKSRWGASERGRPTMELFRIAAIIRKE